MIYNIIYNAMNPPDSGHLCTGGEDHQYAYNEILQFHPDTKEWILAGHMIEERYQHALSVINFKDVRELCILLQDPVIQF